MTSPWTVERWISSPDEVEYSAYWNDAEAERGKAWDVSAGGFEGVERYLGEVGLTSDLHACLQAAEAHRGHPLRGMGIDVAAGTLWAAPILLADPQVERLWCVEFSQHRLLEIGPLMLEHYGVPADRVVLALGSFYDLKLPDASLDFAFLSQAFHHADRPQDLLAELRRVLAADGVVVIVGEHRIRRSQFARYYLAAAMPDAARRRLAPGFVGGRRTLRPRGGDLEPTDPVLGDHTYRDHEYRDLFRTAGFRMQRLRERGAHYQSFLLYPEVTGVQP